MVVSAINYIYGIKVTMDDLLILKEKGHVSIVPFEDSDEPLCIGHYEATGKKYNVINLPHRARWTEYEDEEDKIAFFGLHKLIEFGTYKKIQIKFPIDDMIKLSLLLKEIFPDKKLNIILSQTIVIVVVSVINICN